MKKIVITLICLTAMLAAQTTPGKVWSNHLLNEGNNFLSLPAHSFLGSSIANIGDFDTDGVEDFAVGVEGYNNKGGCWILLMNSDGTIKQHTPVSHALTINDYDYFGSAICSAGDLDGDGTNDLAIGARGDDTGGSNSGAVYILMMNSNGSVKSSTKISSATAGFIAGDIAAACNFGSSLAYLNDYNNDTYKEIAVGMPGYSNFQGAIWLLSLKPDGTIQAKSRIDKNSIPAIANFDAFGSSIAQVGDLNADNISDIAVGAPLSEDGKDNGSGCVYLLNLNNNLTISNSQTYSKSSTSLTNALNDLDQFGNALCSLGDLDKNGYPDLAVGSYQSDDGGNSSGAVYVLLLNANGALGKVQKISNTQGSLGFTLPVNVQFGSALASLADIDNNGVNGIVTGLQNFSRDLTNLGTLDLINLYGNALTDSISANDGTNVMAWSTVNPNGLATSVTFEFGKTSAYGSTSTIQTINGSTDQKAGILLTGLELNTLYHYRVKATNSRGYTCGQDKTFTTALASSIDNKIVPTELVLQNNYPNPFNNSTVIAFGLPTSSDLEVNLYNIRGEQVMTLFKGTQTAGWHTLNFNAAGLSSGTYFYKLKTGDKQLLKKMLLLK